MFRPAGELLPGVLEGLVRVLHKRVLLRMIAGLLCRQYECQGGLVVVPRSIGHLRDTQWQVSWCDVGVPQDCWLQGGGGCPAEVYATNICEAVEELGFELTTLVCGDGLRTAET